MLRSMPGFFDQFAYVARPLVTSPLTLLHRAVYRQGKLALLSFGEVCSDQARPLCWSGQLGAWPASDLLIAAINDAARNGLCR